MLEKFGRHAMDRLLERTSLPPEVISQLDQFADRHNRQGIAPGHYFKELPDHQGYAAFKTVGNNRPKLVLATILSRDMHPKGVKLALAQPVDEERRQELQARFKSLSSILGRRGVLAGTTHKRIVIPKSVLSEADLHTLGFKRVFLAVPEAGQDRFTSYRHPDNTFHLHSHGDRWTMHKDRHPAATMLMPSKGPLKSLALGLPHVVTEGLPGFYYYLKGQALGRGSTADVVSEQLRDETKSLIDKAAADGEEPEAPHRSLLRRFAPAVAMGAAGLGAYGLARRPVAQADPRLARFQRIAQRGSGYHRVVDVDYPGERKPFQWEPSKSVLRNTGRLLDHATTPTVDPATHQLDGLNRLKLHLREGPGAIPIAWHPEKEKPFVPLAGGENGVNVTGLVQGRVQRHPDYQAAVRGGTDVEGDKATLRRINRFALGGKLQEARVLREHLPDAFPHTELGIGKYLRGARGAAGPARARELQRQISKDPNFAGGYWLKPSHGLSSSGQLPTHASDWGAELARFRTEGAKDPAVRRAMRALASNPYDNASTDALKAKNLLAGYQLHRALQEPGQFLLQRNIPGYHGEWRVHVRDGAAPPGMMVPRFGDSIPSVAADFFQQDRGALQKWVEENWQRLPSRLQKGEYGADVALVKKPDGSTGYQFIELNPTTAATRKRPDFGSGSGFLDYDTVPWMGHMDHQAMTGKDTPLLAGIKAAPVALGAGALAHRLIQKDDQA